MSNIDMNQLMQFVDNRKKEGKVFSGFAKKLTYFIIIFIFLFGILGSFRFMDFDMAAFTNFIPAFAWLVVPLIIMIGVNSAVEKHEDAEVKKTEVISRKE